MALYSKESLMKSLKYNSKSDVLAVILEDGKYYSFEDVDVALDSFFGVKSVKSVKKKDTKNKKGKVKN